MRIRIVEDIVELASLLKMNLEGYDHNVVTSTAHFERLLTPDPWRGIDLALVDLMLPTVSGSEILEYLRDNHPYIRRVAMSASLGHAEKATGLAHKVLVKPFSTQYLLGAL